MNKFLLKAPYKPTGDQPQAIAELAKGFKEGYHLRELYESAKILSEEDFKEALEHVLFSS